MVDHSMTEGGATPYTCAHMTDEGKCVWHTRTWADGAKPQRCAKCHDRIARSVEQLLPLISYDDEVPDAVFDPMELRAASTPTSPMSSPTLRERVQDALRQWHEKLGYPAAQEGEISIGADAVLAAISTQDPPAAPILWRGIPIAEAQNMREYWLEAYPDGNFPEGI